MDIIQQALAQALANAQREFAAGRLARAGTLCQQILAANPRHAQAALLLGTVAVKTGQIQAGIAILERAAALDSQSVATWAQLAAALRDTHAYERAIQCLTEAVGLRPDAPLYSNLSMLYGAIGDNQQAHEMMMKARQQAPADAQIHSNLLFGMNFLDEVTSDELLRAHREWDQVHGSPDDAKPRTQGFERVNRDPERPLRVGYVSPNFQSHPVAFFIEPLIVHHARDRVIPYCYANAVVPDEITARLKKSAAVWRDITGLSDQRVVEMIVDDQIDILVDLAGHTADHRLTVFARRAAPVQVTYLGYPATSGIRAMDYRLTDPWIDPPGAEDQYVEKLLRLPETFAAYQPPLDLPVEEPPMLHRGYVTLGCLANVGKFSDAALQAWAAILRAAPETQLLLTIPGLEQNPVLARVRKHLAQAGVAEDRLRLKSRLSLREYLQAHHEVDLYLDTFPVSGHTVLCHAAWMGVPCVCLGGPRAWNRLGTSVLHNLGLPELVASTVDHYVEMVLGLIRNKDRLIDLRRTTRQRLQLSPIMDYPRFAQQAESAYRQVWQRWITAGEEV